MKFYHPAYKSPSTPSSRTTSLDAVSQSADRIGSCGKPLLKTAVALLSVSLASTAFAQFPQSGTWTSTSATGDWSTAANWQGGIVADGDFNTADFSTIDLQGDQTVHLDTPRTIGNLIFGDTNPTTAGGWLLDKKNGDAANVLTLSSGNTIIFADENGGGKNIGNAITVNALGAGKTATISANINSIGGPLSKVGDGTLVLAGNTNLNGNELRAYGAGTLAITGTTTGVTNLYLLGTSTLLLDNGAALTTGANGSYLSLGWALDQNNNQPVDVTAIMRGTSTWTHTGSDFNISDVDGTKGSLTLQGSASLTSAGWIYVSKNLNTSATLTVSENSNLSGNGNLVVGGGNGANGKLIQSGGTITVQGETWIANNGGGNGSFTKTGGTYTANNWFVVGRNGGTGTFDFSAGSLTKGVNGNFIVADGNGAVGTMNLSGTAALTDNNEFWVGNGGGSNGTVNMTGGTLTANDWVAIGRNGGTGVFNLDGGTINKPVGTGSAFIVGAGGGSTGTLTQKGGDINVSVGNTWIGEGGTGTWNMSGGTLTSPTLSVGRAGEGNATLAVSGNAQIRVGRLVVGDLDTAQGTVTQTGGTVSETDGGGENQLGSAAGTTGTYNLNGGTLSMGLNNFQIGANGTGVFNQTGGTATAGSFAAIGRFETGVGTLNLSGGTFTQVGGAMIVAEQGKGTLNVSGTGLLDVTGDHMTVGQETTGQGIVNLNGGTIRTNFIQAGAGSAQLNLNGGVLQARRTEYDFLRGFTSANTELQAGGVIVDTNGFDVGIGAALDGTGGITKRGQGSLSLTGAQTYTGTTKIQEGTIFLTDTYDGTSGALVSGSLSGNIAVADGAVFDVSGVQGGYSVKAGTTLSGGGRITGAIRLESGARIAPGDLTGTLTLEPDYNSRGGLTLSQNGGNVLEFGLGSISDVIALIGGTFLGNETGFTDISITDAGGFKEGTYNLITWTNTTTTSGVDLADFRLSGLLPNGLAGSLQLGADSLQLVVIPEPSAAALLGVAGASFLGFRRRRRS